ncbi:hypothetical protein K450DRAFT_229865 [Umbelopsis ramanniana AG]|uniref:Uncharacterized protein n=1 Tax=Umbelopsis ramanniana AG TaxID=1314678 RepID=A0AAD5HGT7_UMBRA|nr:uncharacterized protein K450DRAFT_229865 [Umbelopsis ramanniana AG]KAI8581911.1 hypothetical protein K450DRAFT_229865 [Umbelopsis ramanniana AG]
MCLPVIILHGTSVFPSLAFVISTLLFLIPFKSHSFNHPFIFLLTLHSCKFTYFFFLGLMVPVSFLSRNHWI